MTAQLEETSGTETFSAENFLGNSLLASVLDDSEKISLFHMVEYHKFCESQRRGYALSMREGLTSFFMDPENLRNKEIRSYLEKLLERDSNRVLVNCLCDNETVESIQIPQLAVGYRDHRYYMVLDEHRDVSEAEAKADFDRNYTSKWAILFRGIYDSVVCPKAYNCSRAEQNVSRLLDRLGFVSEKEWMETVHGEPVEVCD